MLKIGDTVKILEKKLFRDNVIHTGVIAKIDYDTAQEIFSSGAKDEYHIKLENDKVIIIDETYRIYNKYKILDVIKD